MAFRLSGQVVGPCLHHHYAGLHRLSCRFHILAGLFGGGGKFHAGALIKEFELFKCLMPHFPKVANVLASVISCLPLTRIQILVYTPDDLDHDLETSLTYLAGS